MKTFLLLLLTLLYTLISFSQSNKLTVNYKTKTTYSTESMDPFDRMDSWKVDFSIKLKQDTEEMEYTLEIDGKQAECKVALRLRFADYELNSIAFVSKGHRFYVDDKVFLEQMMFMEEEYLITEKINYFDWKLKNVTKEILGFTCYLATYETTGRFAIKIDAWYAPELSFPFGPNGYHGLPGLILETVKDDILTHTASSIVYDVEQFISKPSTGKVMSRAQFDKKLKKYLGEMGVEEKN